MKSKRQALLISLIESGEVNSQATAKKLLAKEGIRVTQATLSRDLEEIGAVRGNSKEGTKYTLSKGNAQFGATLRQVFRSFVISISWSGNTVVVKTPPGHASIVAAAIDREGKDQILGTVAGDDTLFVCTARSDGGEAVGKALEQLTT